MPHDLQAHCQSPSSPSTDQSFVKELAKPTQEKKKFKKMTTARQKTMKMTATNRPTNHGRQGSTGGNMRLASCGVKCLNSSSVSQINFSAGLTVLCPEIPHERQAQKRYRSC